MMKIVRPLGPPDAILLQGMSEAAPLRSTRSSALAHEQDTECRLDGLEAARAAAMVAHMQAVLDSLAVGIVGLKGEHVRFLNRAARTLLATTSGLTVERGQISLGNPAAMAEFRQAVGSGSSSFHIVERDGAPCLLLQVVAPGVNWSADRDLMMLFLVDVAQPPHLDWPALQRFFKLGDAERQVLELFLRGLSLEQVARQRRVSMPTLRTQMRSLFMKTCTENQVGLMRLLGRIVASPHNPK